MHSSYNLLALTAILALATLPTTTVAAKKNLRRGQINHINDVSKNKEEGLEEDVAFWTNMSRRMQYMSIPTDSPPVPAPSTNPPVGGGGVPTNPPVLVGVSSNPPSSGGGAPTFPPFSGGVPTNPPVGGGGVPTLPPFSGGIPTLPPQGVITPPPVPVAGIICAQAETCAVVDDVCSDGTTEECCGETFESFVCTCLDSNGSLAYDCVNTDACLDRVCETLPPAAGPTPTNSPIQDTGGFKCPDPNFVGCTAVDPANPDDECPTVGEPCPNAIEGEFCCLDGCPRNYCTAKQAPMSVNEPVQMIMALPDDWKNMLNGLERNDP